MKIIGEFLKDIANPTVFELGVHWGEDTQTILNWCKGVPNYHGFEPDKRNIEKIRQRWGDRKPQNVKINEGAISNKVGTATLYLSDGSNPRHHGGEPMTGSNSIREPYKHLPRHPWITFNKSVEVSTFTIDTYCKQEKINNIDFIWSDIQGAEYDMLLGAKEMLGNIGIMLLEYSDIELYKGQGSLTDMLNLLGKDWELVEKGDYDVIVRNKNY